MKRRKLQQLLHNITWSPTETLSCTWRKGSESFLVQELRGLQEQPRKRIPQCLQTILAGLLDWWYVSVFSNSLPCSKLLGGKKFLNGNGVIENVYFDFMMLAGNGCEDIRHSALIHSMKDLFYKQKFFICRCKSFTDDDVIKTLLSAVSPWDDGSEFWDNKKHAQRHITYVCTWVGKVETCAKKFDRTIKKKLAKKILKYSLTDLSLSH